MENNEVMVAAQETAAEMPAADAQAAEITVEEVIAKLNAGMSAQEKVENEGDDSHQAQEETQEKPGKTSESARRDNQMRSALKQQRKTIFEKDLGMPEEQVRELIRAHKAAEMAKKDPEISEKAAMMIVKAQESAAEQQDAIAVTEEQRGDVLSLMTQGWTQEALLEFAQDRQAMEDILGGMSVAQAAQEYKGRKEEGVQQTSARRKSAPIARGTSAGSTSVQNPIDAMTDEQYDAFMADVRRRAMRGEKVKF